MLLNKIRKIKFIKSILFLLKIPTLSEFWETKFPIFIFIFMLFKKFRNNFFLINPYYFNWNHQDLNNFSESKFIFLHLIFMLIKNFNMRKIWINPFYLKLKILRFTWFLIKQIYLFSFNFYDSKIFSKRKK